MPAPAAGRGASTASDARGPASALSLEPDDRSRCGAGAGTPRSRGRVTRSRLADLPIDEPDLDASDGWNDYRAAFDPAFALERLSTRALVIVLTEFLAQTHLLVRSLHHAVSDLSDVSTADDVIGLQFIGAGRLAAERIRDVLGANDGSIDDMGGRSSRCIRCSCRDTHRHGSSRSMAGAPA